MQARRELLAEKLLDVANIAVAAMIFGQRGPHGCYGISYILFVQTNHVHVPFHDNGFSP